MSEFDYDIAVIGGGSGGMAAAKKAANLGAKTVLFDFVKPSPHGTTWGLGGTCVNVGCVPKKIFHHAGNIGYLIHNDATKFGYSNENSEPLIEEAKYEDAATRVKQHIKKLNFGYKNGVVKSGVKYINGLAKLTCNPHEVSYKVKNKGEEEHLTAKYILICTGGRPNIPTDVAGSEHAISSDDLFWMKESPGKTLVVGGSYIALECSGYLTHMGVPVTCCVRSIVLRGFDRQCSEKVLKGMKETGTLFKEAVTPVSIERLTSEGPKQLKVTFSDNSSDVYNTVMFATGREADIQGLALEGRVNVTQKKQIVVDHSTFATTAPDVFAIGDIINDALELTPVAIKQGEYLANRLFNATAQTPLDWRSNVATTVFTPLEYGCVGLSEEDAIATYGEDNIEVYLNEFGSLESTAAQREKAKHVVREQFDDEITANCLAKVVCTRGDEKVLGIHYVGENAGELIQGFACAMNTGVLTKKHLDSTVGIHPTNAEAFCQLEITRRSGVPFLASGGCGGGKCG